MCRCDHHTHTTQNFIFIPSHTTTTTMISKHMYAKMFGSVPLIPDSGGDDVSGCRVHPIMKTVHVDAGTINLTTFLANNPNVVQIGLAPGVTVIADSAPTQRITFALIKWECPIPDILVAWSCAFKFFDAVPPPPYTFLEHIDNVAFINVPNVNTMSFMEHGHTITELSVSGTTSFQMSDAGPFENNHPITLVLNKCSPVPAALLGYFKNITTLVLNNLSLRAVTELHCVIAQVSTLRLQDLEEYVCVHVLGNGEARFTELEIVHTPSISALPAGTTHPRVTTLALRDVEEVDTFLRVFPNVVHLTFEHMSLNIHMIASLHTENVHLKTSSFRVPDGPTVYTPSGKVNLVLYGGSAWRVCPVMGPEPQLFKSVTAVGTNVVVAVSDWVDKITRTFIVDVDDSSSTSRVGPVIPALVEQRFNCSPVKIKFKFITS